MDKLDEAAISWSWLAKAIGLTGNQTPSPVLSAWSKLKDDRNHYTGGIIRIQKWTSDFWIASTYANALGMLAPRWAIDEEIDDWPTFGMSRMANWKSLHLKATNSQAMEEYLNQSSRTIPEFHHDAHKQFWMLHNEIKSHRDERMIQVSQVRAWVDACFGSLLAGIVFTPPDDPILLKNATIDRLGIPLETTSKPTISFLDDVEIGLLYNTFIEKTGVSVQQQRQGQGEQWRDHWGWLSAPLGAREMLVSVRLTAQLMRCQPLLSGLLEVMHQPNETLRRLALCVIRRWLLTLKALAWLEKALSHPWIEVRPQDLACIAFNSVRPGWPRGLVAISHRSAEVKPTLQEMRIWKSAAGIIDATYVPAWETNTGMIWGLFSTAPLIARVSSPRYADSIWCKRESELVQYLLEDCDYLSNRYVVDLRPDELRELDGLIDFVRLVWAASLQDPDSAVTIQKHAEFPPHSMVFTAQPFPEWQLLLLRAAGALRIINAVAGDSNLTNQICERLLQSAVLNAPAPTNNQDGWNPYHRAFADLCNVFGLKRNRLPLRLPLAYRQEELQIDQMLLLSIPDLSGGEVDLLDVFAAVEWWRTPFHWFNDEDFGDHIVVDIEGISAQQWMDDIRLSVMRGIVSLRINSPVWIQQKAGQNAHTWPLLFEKPLFTRHLNSQFDWMMQTVLLSPWPHLYLASSGLEIDQELQKLVQKASDDGTYRLMGDKLERRDVLGIRQSPRMDDLLRANPDA